MAKLGIKMDYSSAMHSSGDLHAENAVKQVKRSIAYCRFNESFEQIWELNMNQHYNTTNITPFEALHGMYNPVSGIPMTAEQKKFLGNCDWVTQKQKNPNVNFSNLPNAGARWN